jgi:ferritin-like metal-binding protein YciE
MPTIDSLEKLFEHDLKDVYDAEKRLTKALPKMAKAAKSTELRDAFKEHLQVTQTQVGRLEQIFESIGKRAVGKTCNGMKGLIEEGEETISTEGVEPYNDLGLISAARRVEHYEIAAYMSLRSLATQMDDPNVIQLIEENLREEQEADEMLAELSTQLLEGEDSDEDGEEVGEEEDEEVSMTTAKSSSRRR